MKTLLMIAIAGMLALGGYKKEETTTAVTPTPGTLTLSWERFPTGLFKQISVGRDGLVWGIGTNNHVFRLNSARTDWDELSSSPLLTQVSVASDGAAWGLNSDNEIFRWRSNAWGFFDKGLLKCISVGKSGLVYGIGTNNRSFRLNNVRTDWEELSSSPSLSQVSVAADGTAWGLDSGNKIFKWNGSAWVNFDKGLLKQISVGRDGLVYGIGTNSHVFRLNSAGTDWNELTPTVLLTQVAVASDGTTWGLNSNGEIFYLVNN